jgi:endo-1,4-beta-xylanase
VVNEVLSDTDDRWLRNASPWRAIGDDLVVRAFKFAAEADPDAELYYNDYNIDLPGKCTRALHLIEQLRAAGCRLDAVGIQGHWHLHSLNLPMIEASLVRFEDAGIKVMITEMDVSVLEGESNPYEGGLPAEVEYRLAAAYAGLFALFGRHKSHIKRVSFWGTHDGMSWLNGWPIKGRTNYPLVFDRNLRPKPAYHASVAALRQATR